MKGFIFDARACCFDFDGKSVRVLEVGCHLVVEVKLQIFGMGLDFQWWWRLWKHAYLLMAVLSFVCDFDYW